MAVAISHFNGKPGLLRSHPSRTPPLLSLNRPLVAAMAHNQSSYWASIDADVEVHLKRSIPVRPPVVVFEPLHHLVFAAPKTTAPALCIAACELMGGHRDQAMAAASALHLMHAAAYTHENLPLTDRPKPRPAVHHAFGTNVELLTGDAIVPLGFELLARSSSGPMLQTGNPARTLRVIIEITRAVGSQGVVDGQYREYLGSVVSEICDEGWMESVCRKKEGEMHACGAACGAILGGGSEEEIAKLRKFGLYVGMIQGMLSHGVGRNEKRSRDEVVEELKVLAVKELEGLKGRKVESLSSLVELEPNLCNV